MSRFKKVRSKAELDNLINTLTKNRKILQDEVTSEVVGKEFAKQGAQEQASPITAELQKVVKKIDQVLNPTQMKNKVPGKPWLGEEPETEVDKDTGERRNVEKNLLNSVLQAIKNNHDVFAPLLKQIHQTSMHGNFAVMQGLSENKAEISSLSTKLKTDLSGINNTVQLISDVLNVKPDEILNLLKRNLKESRDIVIAVRKLNDTGAFDDELNPLPSDVEDAEDKLLETPDDSYTLASSGDPATPYVPRTTASTSRLTTTTSKKAPPPGTISSTTIDSIAPNPGNDDYDDRNEKAQEKRASNQLNALDQVSEEYSMPVFQSLINKLKISSNDDIQSKLLNSPKKMDIINAFLDSMSRNESNDILNIANERASIANVDFYEAAAAILGEIIEDNVDKGNLKLFEKKLSAADQNLSPSSASSSQKNPKSPYDDEIEKLEQQKSEHEFKASPINSPGKHNKQVRTRARKAADKANEKLKELKRQRGYGIESHASTKRSYDPYRMDGNGVMGKLQIDKDLLNRLMLRVHKDGQQIAYQPIPYDLVELLTKKYNSRKQYHPDAIELFQKLIRHSDIPFDSVKNNKFKNIISKLHEQEGNGQIWDPLTNLIARNAVNSANTKRVSEGRAAVDMPDAFKGDFRQTGNGCSCEDNEPVRIVDSPEEAFNRLNILLGEIEAGNSAKEITNEIGQLLEYLHKHNHINDDGYKGLMKACGLSD